MCKDAQVRNALTALNSAPARLDMAVDGKGGQLVGQTVK